MKNFLSLIAAFVVLAALNACGNKSNITENETQVEPSSVINVVTIDNSYMIPQTTVIIFKEDSLFGLKTSAGDILLPAIYAEILYYRASDFSFDEYAFWRKKNSFVERNFLPDAQVIADRYNLVICKDTLAGIYSKKGEELLPMKYLDICPMEGAKSYQVSFDDEDMAIWKDGRFIIHGKLSEFHGIDLQKQRFVFSNGEGKNWEFYDFDGKNRQTLKIKKALDGFYIPQYLETNRFLLLDGDKSCITDAAGNSVVKLKKWADICGNFLLVPSKDKIGCIDVLFNNGKLLVSEVDLAYPIVSKSVPYLSTGEIVIEKNAIFVVYDQYGKRIKKVDGIICTSLFDVFDAGSKTETENKVLVCCETDMM